LKRQSKNLKKKMKEQKDSYENQLRQLNAALKASKEEKSSTVIELKKVEYEEEEEEDDQVPTDKNRGCFSWFSKEQPQPNINRNYAKKKKIDEEKQTT